MSPNDEGQPLSIFSEYAIKHLSMLIINNQCTKEKHDNEQLKNETK